MVPSCFCSTSYPVSNDYPCNAKYDDMICYPIKPLYDGIPDNLVPILNQLDAWNSRTKAGDLFITYSFIQGKQ
jgi:hypothetical protein